MCRQQDGLLRLRAGDAGDDVLDRRARAVAAGKAALYFHRQAELAELQDDAVAHLRVGFTAGRVGLLIAEHARQHRGRPR